MLKALLGPSVHPVGKARSDENLTRTMHNWLSQIYRIPKPDFGHLG